MGKNDERRRSAAGKPGNAVLDDALRGASTVIDPDATFVDEDPNGGGGYASPPCFMHELDPSQFGYLTLAEVLDLLNHLLEAERAGARGVGAISRRAGAAPRRAVLRDVARDEARYCAMLTRHIRRLGGAPSVRTGGFYDKLLALASYEAQLDLLDRGQGWVARKLREALPQIADEALRADLAEMLETHERNIERCANLQRTI